MSTKVIGTKTLVTSWTFQDPVLVITMMRGPSLSFHGFFLQTGKSGGVHKYIILATRFSYHKCLQNDKFVKLL